MGLTGWVLFRWHFKHEPEGPKNGAECKSLGPGASLFWISCCGSATRSGNSELALKERLRASAGRAALCAGALRGRCAREELCLEATLRRRLLRDALAAQTYSVASYDSFGYASIGIPKTERRGITLPQLERIGSFIEDHAHFWIETYSGSPNFGEALEAQSLNLHHASYWLISPATRQFMCSFVELVAKEAEEQRPWWFVSHAWQEAVLRFVACLRRHASLRNATQSAYWVCAYANNQHKLEEEICLNPRSTSFYRAMMQCVGVVLILDKDATPFTRIWCCFEESIAVEECNAGSPLLLDVAATDSSNEAHVLTDGLAAAELQQMPLIGFLAKSVREAAFPTALAEKELTGVAPSEDANYLIVNKALAGHFALASIFGTFAHGGNTHATELLSAVVTDTTRQIVELSFTGCRGFGNSSLLQLLSHLPRQLRMLRLDLCFSGVQSWDFPEELPALEHLTVRFTGSQLANASGLGLMLAKEPISKSLRCLQLWLSNVPHLTELGSWESLAKLQLEELLLQLNSCSVSTEARQSLYDCVQRLKHHRRGLDLRVKIEGITERSWPWASWAPRTIKDQELTVTRGKILDVDLPRPDPFPCSCSGCGVFHDNLHGFCQKHRLWRYGWKLASLGTTAWSWTELSFLLAMQAAAEVEHRATLVVILGSLYPVACMSLEESLGVPWAATCTLLLLALLCSLVTTSIRFDQMHSQILKQCVAAEASYTQVLEIPDSGMRNMIRVPTMGGCGDYGDPQDLCQPNTDQFYELSQLFTDAQSRLPAFGRAMGLALPDAAVKMKLLVHLSDKEQQSPRKVLDALHCELVCKDMPGVQQAFKSLKDQVNSEESSIHIVAVRDTFAQMSGQKYCQVVLDVENYFCSVFLMDATLTRLECELNDVTKLAEQFGLLDDMKSKWETSLRLRNYAPSVRRPFILAVTIVLQVVALVVSLFMAVQYFLRYAHRIRSQLPDFLLDVLLLDKGATEESGETGTSQAAVLALPYFVLTAGFVRQLVCREFSTKRPRPTQVLYEKHFGLRGTYYPIKVAILQALTVAVQACGKIYLLGGIVTFAEYQEGEFGSTTSSLKLGFWAFCALLCWNSLYPALLLFFPQSAFARIGAALMDAALDLGYIVTYLGIVLVAMLRLQTAEDVWGNFGEDLTLQFSNRISPAFGFPTDFLGYSAVYITLAHASCIAHVLQRINWSLPVGVRAKRSKWQAPCQRCFGLLLSTGLAVMLVFLLATKEGFPTSHARDFLCFPCRCSTEASGRRIESCSLAAVLRQEQLNLANNNITSIADGAFNPLGCQARRLALSNNSLVYLSPDLFQGLRCLEHLDLTRSQLQEFHEDAFRGLERLKMLSASENNITQLSAAVLRHLPALEQLLLGGKDDQETGRTIVEGNPIEELGAAILKRNPKLRVIDLSLNKLRHIDPAAFQGLRQLQTLDLGYNKLTNITASTFQGLVQLQTLDLWHNELTNIAAGTFQGLVQLQTLDLQQNKLTNIAAIAFQGLVQLQTLSLERNKLTNIAAGAFQGLVRLQTLDLHSNRLTDIAADAFQGLVQLQTLDLSYNYRLTNIAAGTFQGLVQLQTLDLKANRLTNIAAGTFQGLVRLQTLDLERNRLIDIAADTFQGLVQLQTLDLDRNRLTDIAAGTFQGLVRLQNLSLYDNELTNIAAGAFQGLVQLQSLQLKENDLTNITAGAFQGLVQLQTLDLEGNRLTDIAAGAFQGLVQLQTLDLKANRLTNIAAGTFQGLVRLQTLDLERNRLIDIAADTFQGLVQLQTLDLSGNKLTNIAAGAFQGLVQLQTLSLERNKLTNIAAGTFQGLVRLQTLDLHSNRLTDIAADAFQDLVQLQTLNLWGNRFADIAADIFHGLVQLQTLKLGGNRIADIAAGTFQGLVQLQTLDLQWNDLTDIAADTFQGLVQLQTLDLQWNVDLTDIAADAFQGLVQLQTLDLSYNRLTNMSADTFPGLAQLQSLYLTGNRLTDIAADTFQALVQLQNLSLYGNELTNIAAGAFQGLVQLQTLDLSYNRLTNIAADTFQGLAQLQSLYLERNKLTNIAAGAFQGLVRLQTLDLERNRLIDIAADTFQGLVQLQTLDLSLNKLTNIAAGAFQGLVQLQTLNLWGNELTNIAAGTFQGLVQLQTLNLWGNELTNIAAGTFQDLVQLQTLDLKANRLTNIAAGTFHGLVQLETLDLRGNAWNLSNVSCISGSFPRLKCLEGDLPSCEELPLEVCQARAGPARMSNSSIPSSRNEKPFDASFVATPVVESWELQRSKCCWLLDAVMPLSSDQKSAQMRR
eukprot:s549_g10.t3